MLYRTSCPVQKSGEISKSRLSRNRTFSSSDAGLLKIEEKSKHLKQNWKKIQIFSKKILFIHFWHQIHAKGPYFIRINNPYLVSEMFKDISPGSIRSSRTCPAYLGIRSCPVRKLICPVRLSPRFQPTLVAYIIGGHCEQRVMVSISWHHVSWLIEW